MKAPRFFLSLTAALSVAAVTTNAQTIPNAGFETWANQSINTPAGPLVFNTPTQGWEPGFITTLLTLFGQPVHFSKGTVAHSGTASLKFVTGADSVGGDLQISFPIPSGANIGQLKVWSRAAAPQADPGEGFQIVAFLTHSRGAGLDSDTTAVCGLSTQNAVANTWEQTSEQFFQFNSNVPDSAHIWVLFMPELANRQAWLDDISFAPGTPTGLADDAATAQALTLGPNPVTATTPVFAQLTATKAGEATLTITDVLGRRTATARVELQAGDNRVPVPTAALAPGVYFVRTVGTTETRPTRLVIQ